jgi:fumarate reductase flavoprotein subunit
MEQIMTDKVGLFRNGPICKARSTNWRTAGAQPRGRRARRASRRQPGTGAGLPPAAHAEGGAERGAGRAARTESRGAHFREDHPARNDRDWLNRTLACWREGAALPTLDYEPLDVMQMELPPGFRGYGVKNIVEHPASAIAPGRGR